jgi:sulfate transport system ATP-binding protein
MHEGRVVQAGSPHDLYDHPATPFVASFLGSASVISGQLRDGRVTVGETSNAGVPSPGAAVQAWVRPHEVKLVRKALPGDVSRARLERLARVGAYVKVELVLASGDLVTVQLPKPELDALGVVAGDEVLVELGEARVFVDDYTI